MFLAERNPTERMDKQANPFWPGNRALISDEHSQLVQELRHIEARFTNATVHERAILKMTIDLFEYMRAYALGPTSEEYNSLPQERQSALLSEYAAKPSSFTVEEFINELICSGGIELHSGRCAPRFR